MNFGALDLNTVWFVLIGVLFTGYPMLHGFDLGVGSIHLFTKEDHDRRVLLNAIGPVWDGNEVWLVSGGGALFAAFPNVYATVFSGFYFAFVLLLVALSARAIEFRSKQPMGWWRQMWDVGFAGGSILSSLLIGIAMGNIAWGVPIDERGIHPARMPASRGHVGLPRIVARLTIAGHIGFWCAVPRLHVLIFFPGNVFLFPYSSCMLIFFYSCSPRAVSACNWDSLAMKS